MGVERKQDQERGQDRIGRAPGQFGHCEPPDFTRRHPPEGQKSQASESRPSRPEPKPEPA